MGSRFEPGPSCVHSPCFLCLLLRQIYVIQMSYIRRRTHYILIKVKKAMRWLLIDSRVIKIHEEGDWIIRQILWWQHHCQYVLSFQPEIGTWKWKTRTMPKVQSHGAHLISSLFFILNWAFILNYTLWILLSNLALVLL